MGYFICKNCIPGVPGMLWALETSPAYEHDRMRHLIISPRADKPCETLKGKEDAGCCEWLGWQSPRLDSKPAEGKAIWLSQETSDCYLI